MYLAGTKPSRWLEQNLWWENKSVNTYGEDADEPRKKEYGFGEKIMSTRLVIYMCFRMIEQFDVELINEYVYEYDRFIQPCKTYVYSCLNTK